VDEKNKMQKKNKNWTWKKIETRRAKKTKKWKT
jgi:hypothetical protein